MILSKDEFIACLYYIDSAAYTQAYKEKAVAHDQAQRAVIARLEAEHKDLVLRNKLLRDRPDLPLERIQAYDEVITKIEQQAKEIAELKECEEIANWFQTLVTRACIGTKQTPSLKAYLEQVESQNKTLREVLQDLMECLEDDCRLDHHGYCQNHFVTIPCVYKKAQRTLKEVS